jgi:predicted pyridoxine 5'-phosphate oxidase superfamily flavin-nucleotide-binding protein
VFDESVIEFLHSGCAVLVGTVDSEGTPHACRAWGLTVVDATNERLRLLADADDRVTMANLTPGAMVAITVAGVATFRSMQMKGCVVGTDTLTDADLAKQAQYTDDFVHDISLIDRVPEALLRRWSDRRVVPFLVDIDSSFDQTPGPSAGCALKGSEP